MPNLLALSRGLFASVTAQDAQRRRVARRQFRPSGLSDSRLEGRELPTPNFYFTGGLKQACFAGVMAAFQPQNNTLPAGAAADIIEVYGPQVPQPAQPGDPPIMGYAETAQTSSTVGPAGVLGGQGTEIVASTSMINTDQITNAGGSNGIAPIQAFAFSRNGTTVDPTVNPVTAADYTWSIEDAVSGYPRAYALVFNFSATFSETNPSTGNPRAFNQFNSAVAYQYQSTFFNVVGGRTGFTLTDNTGQSTFFPNGASVTRQINIVANGPMNIGFGFYAELRTNPSEISSFTPGTHLHSASFAMIAQYSLAD